jgi:predicted permease
MIDAVIIIFLTLLPIIIIGGAGYGIYRWNKARKEAGLKKEPENK